MNLIEVINFEHLFNDFQTILNVSSLSKVSKHVGPRRFFGESSHRHWGYCCMLLLLLLLPFAAVAAA